MYSSRSIHQILSQTIYSIRNSKVPNCRVGHSDPLSPKSILFSRIMNGEEIKTISTVSRDSKNGLCSTTTSNSQTSPGSSRRREFHSDLRWCDDVPCKLSMRSICSSWPWLYLYLFYLYCLILVMEHIQSKRDCVSGVTAIYFVEPTERNVSLILDVWNCLKQWSSRISWRSSLLLEQRVVSIGCYEMDEWSVE